MRSIIVVLIICLLSTISVVAQQTITKNIEHDGLDRTYIIYIPETYSAEKEAPLLLNFHGYTSNAGEQMAYGDFRSIADAQGLILVHPEGEILNGASHWNVGGWTQASTVDDVGFTAAMIEEISSEYKIDQKRIYATGMSNGGFMSYLLACQLSNKIAAIASVTGSMTPQTYSACNPQHPIPVLYIHGTFDNVVPYGGAAWTNPVTTVLDYWTSKNECDAILITEDIPNTNLADGSTVEKISYLNGDSGSEVIHYKVIGGNHTWPGTSFVTPGTNLDFNASEIIWQFLSRYDIDGLIDVSTSNDLDISQEEVSIYPNPATSKINITFDTPPNLSYELRNLSGALMLNGKFTQVDEFLNISRIPVGNYILKIGTKDYQITKVD